MNKSLIPSAHIQMRIRRAAPHQGTADRRNPNKTVGRNSLETESNINGEIIDECQGLFSDGWVYTGHYQMLPKMEHSL